MVDLGRWNLEKLRVFQDQGWIQPTARAWVGFSALEPDAVESSFFNEVF